jgi:inner membrane protein
MDTLTHALSGALLARLIAARRGTAATHGAGAAPASNARQGRFTAAWDSGPGAVAPWQCVTVGFLAGAFPDVDAVAQLWGDVFYLTQHRGITHSLLMAPLWALALAWLASKAFAVTRTQRGGWKSLYPVVLGAILIHIAGDWITQFGTMLLQPLSDQRFGLGAMFIIDLTFSGLLVAGLLLAALLPRARWPAAVSLAAACAWVGLAWVGQQEAIAAGQAKARALGIASPAIVVMPRPASPFNWTVTVSDGSTYHVAHLNTRRTEPLVATADDHFIRRFSAPYLPVATAPWEAVARFGPAGTPDWVARAFDHPDFAFYRWFALTPALVDWQETPAAAGGAAERCVLFRDLRFEFPGRGESPFRYGLCAAADAAGAQPGSARLFRIEDGQRQPV